MCHQTLLRQFMLSPMGNYDTHHVHRVRDTLESKTPLKKAAVLILFVKQASSFNLILIQRAHHLKHHPGQIAFPGGRFEPEDDNLMVTAQRETLEEIGLTIPQSEIFGHLPPLITVSGYEVIPYLATISHDYEAILDHNEVANLFEIPLSYLLDPENRQSHTILHKKKPHTIETIAYQDHTIWGATAQMITLLSRQLWSENLMDQLS